MEKNCNSEYYSKKPTFIKKYIEERKEKLAKHKDLIEKIKQQGFDKDHKILRALEKNDFNVDKAIENLKEKEKLRAERSEKFQKLKEKLYQEFFPEDKEFNWEKFREKKEELRAFRKLRKEAQYLECFPEDKGKEFDWKKFRSMKRSERLSKKHERKDFKKEKETKQSSTESGFSSDEVILSKNTEKQLLNEDNEKLDLKEINEDYRKFRKFKQSKKEKHCGEKESPEEKDKRLEVITKLINEKAIDTVYLDGNNMLFVDDSIRKDCLNKNTKDGEFKLGKLCFEYARKVGIKGNVLVFDNTKQVYAKESEGVYLKVSSAYPEYESSDDAFKVWAGGMDAEKLKKVLFVTSDRELTDRLKEKQVSHVMRSGEFMKEMKKVLGELYFDCLKLN